MAKAATVTDKLSTVFSKLKSAFSSEATVIPKEFAVNSNPVPTQIVEEQPSVVRSANGGFEVTAYDGWSGFLTHQFGDLITDKATAEKLHNADPNKDYQLGDCGIFAAELWNLNEHVADYFIIKTKSEPVFGTHHFVKLNDGTCVDSQGLWTEEAFLNYWKEIDPTSEISTFDLDDDSIEKNPKFPVSRPELFNLVNELVTQHVTV